MISPALRATLLRRIQLEWTRINEQQLRGALRPPLFELTDAERRIGAWVPAQRTIRLGREIVTERPWGEVVEVLRHEMAHQYAHEVLGARDEAPHGAAFRHAAERLGLATADPAPEDDKVLRRIRHLLSLSESDNAHEAAAALEAAQRLMATVDPAVLDGRDERFAVRHLGPARARHAAWRKVLGGLLAARFHVHALMIDVWDVRTGRTARQLEIAGTPHDVEVAAWVYDALVQAGERLWKAHRAAHGLTGDAERRRFLVGVMAGFSEKAAKTDQNLAREGLVHVPRAGLEDFVARRHARVRRGRPLTVRSGGAFTHGKAAGRTLELHRPVTGDDRPVGRLTGPSGSSGTR